MRHVADAVFLALIVALTACGLFAAPKPQPTAADQAQLGYFTSALSACHTMACIDGVIAQYCAPGSYLLDAGACPGAPDGGGAGAVAAPPVSSAAAPPPTSTDAGGR